MVEVIPETPRAKTLVLEVPQWPGHLAGQHLDVRLTAEDGYQTQRSYSLASPPEDPQVRITVERLEDGEVSPYLTDVLRVGDQLELRGPIGGYFTWEVTLGGPLLLVAGGSGVVPLMAIIRHLDRAKQHVPARLLLSSRSAEDIIYKEELERLANQGVLEVFYTLTRETPNPWTGYQRRIDESMLAEVGWSALERPKIFICGPTALVEAVAIICIALGHEPAHIKTERFGPTS